MQNRNMYLYRRQGPKKRTKPGPPRKNRGSQKGLPNSARDLLPLIQPATKALAQMLAGRTGVSGQLGHARAVLAQTERLVSERAHNRLNPAEREEFFEQVARLKLTLADADSEAEVQAAEEETPAPTPLPVNRERLKEMAMALTSSAASTSDEDERGTEHADNEAELGAKDQAAPGIKDDERPESVPEAAKRPDDPNQLRLPRAGAEQVVLPPGAVRTRPNGRRRSIKTEASAPITDDAAKAKPASTVGAKKKADRVESKGKAELTTATAESSAPASAKKLPKGWIIDEEGFVVPGPAA